MANKIVVAFYIVVCSYLFAANVVDASRINHLACAAVPDGTFVRSTKSCGHYYVCANQAVVAEEKCPDRYLFNEEKQLCDHKNFVNCNSCVQYARPYYADPENCGKYFLCVNGHRRTYNCPFGQLFDHISNRCQAEQQVNCKNDDDDGEVPPIDGPTDTPVGPTDATIGPSGPPLDEWPVPEGHPTRPPPTWGPPRAPPGGFNDDYPTEPTENPNNPTGAPSRPPGIIGTYTPPSTPGEPTEPTTRDPWGPPDSPVGGGGGK